MAKGFLYLVAIIDWASRAVLAWRLSNTMDTAFCLEALHEALVRFGKPVRCGCRRSDRPCKAVLVTAAPCVGVEYLWLAEAHQRLVERLQTEGRVHRIRQPPC